MTEIALLVVALLIDRVVGEPPNALHPVVWIGNTTKLLQKLAPPRGVVAQLSWGVAVALLVPAGFAWGCYALLHALRPWPASLFVVSALLLKATFSLNGLRQAALTMVNGLGTSLDAARYALRNLCSRDPKALSEPQLIAATVESLAENASDSVVAPLFYFALFGVPGALAYRAVNTLDAMIGYHGRYEHLGKAAARLDDLLNIVPARITALLLIVAGAWLGHDARSGFRVMRRDARNTESPNAGWPMAAMAGLLGVRLEKADHYVLGDVRVALSTETIERTWLIVRNAAWIGALAVAVTLGVQHAIE